MPDGRRTVNTDWVMKQCLSTVWNANTCPSKPTHAITAVRHLLIIHVFGLLSQKIQSNSCRARLQTNFKDLWHLNPQVALRNSTRLCNACFCICRGTLWGKKTPESLNSIFCHIKKLPLQNFKWIIQTNFLPLKHGWDGFPERFFFQ